MIQLPKDVENRFKAAFCARRKRQLADFDKAFLEFVFADISAVEEEAAAATKKTEMLAAQQAKRTAVASDKATTAAALGIQL